MANEQRRLAAVVAADVVGFSRLMGQDEAGTLAALKAVRQEILERQVETHGGRLVKTTGDGFLLEFSSSVDAVRWALLVQQEMSRRNATVREERRLVLRIGVNVGDLIVDGEDIFGDCVNVAARLQPIAPPGGLCLSDRAYQDARGRVAGEFQDGGLQQLKNIAEPIRIWQWSEGVLPAAPNATGRAQGGNPSIAVLPLATAGSDPGLAILADGLAEDVIALLARMPGFFVISPASSFAFRDRDADPARIARDLGVRYLVEGSLRRVGDGVRVAVQLTEAATGHVLWSHSLAGHAGDTEDLQDAITRGIVAHLQPELIRAEIAVIRRQVAGNVDAWGHYRQALAAFSLQGWNEANLVEALDHLHRAVAIAPDFALAHAMSALLGALGKTTGVLPPSEALREDVFRAAETAINLDPGSSQVMGYAGCALADMGEVARGIETLHAALEIDPSNAQAHVALGAAMSVAGSETRQDGIAKMRHAMRLSPCDRRLGFWGWALSASLLVTGATEEALAEARLAARRDPKFHLTRIVEALALLRLGEMEAARAALATARRLRPALSLDEIGRAAGGRARAALAPIWAAEAATPAPSASPVSTL